MTTDLGTVRATRKKIKKIDIKHGSKTEWQKFSDKKCVTKTLVWPSMEGADFHSMLEDDLLELSPLVILSHYLVLLCKVEYIRTITPPDTYVRVYGFCLFQ